jgi:N-acetylglucosamine-6-phosphate deacetylase
MTHVLHGRILTPYGWVSGHLRYGERITEISASALSDQDEDTLILPGFIDLHVHGGGGFDVMDGGCAIHAITRLHARHGTTSLLATTMTAPVDDIRSAIVDCKSVYFERPPQSARVLGIHLEGPYINTQRLGAQPDFVRVGHLAEFEQLASCTPVRLVTVAPEIDGHLDLIRELDQRGVRVQLGHSNGTYEDGLAALRHGASGFAHLFNAMSGLHHRAPGMVGAALAHAQFAEIIPDLLHVHPGAILTAARAIPGWYCVTDATAAAGMPDGEYSLGRQRVHKCLGGVRLADGTLAGSALTMDQALRNLVQMGFSIEAASQRTATEAARYLGLSDRGILSTGSWADMVILDSQLTVRGVVIEGEHIELAHAP